MTPKPIVLTREQVRTIDRTAIETLKMPGVVLMENAGRAVAQEILGLIEDVESPRVCIVAGSGNNGGDGFVIGRHLHNAHVDVMVLLVAAPDLLRGDAWTHYRILSQMPVPIHPMRSAEQMDQRWGELEQADVIVDALLGTGFSGQPRAPLDAAILAINAAPGAKVVAVDVPSGLDCDSGIAATPCVQAHLTVTFVARKAGFGHSAAAKYLGRVVVADIGVPRELIEAHQS